MVVLRSQVREGAGEPSGPFQLSRFGHAPFTGGRFIASVWRGKHFYTFLNHLYGGMDEPELKIIDVFICKLRKKLAQATGGEHYIETVWGRGYVLRDPEPNVAASPLAIGA
jgi:hypothetical protein